MEHENKNDEKDFDMTLKKSEGEDSMFQTVFTKGYNLTHNSQNSYQSSAVVFYQTLPVSLLRRDS